MKRILFTILVCLASSLSWAQLKTGTMAPDFTLSDINSKSLRLSSFRGKYVVIDFWGSWCYYCIKGMPMMKDYYSRYKGKLEIIGVDCQDSDADWRHAVKELQLPWKHVYLPRINTLLDIYQVSGFPTKVLVDPKGKVLMYVNGERPEFYSELDKILGKK